VPTGTDAPSFAMVFWSAMMSCAQKVYVCNLAPDSFCLISDCDAYFYGENQQFSRIFCHLCGNFVTGRENSSLFLERIMLLRVQEDDVSQLLVRLRAGNTPKRFR
jgi:hypothetical protein